jgi:hypothetical protein
MVADAAAVAFLVALASAINGLFILRRPDMVFDLPDRQVVSYGH